MKRTPLFLGAIPLTIFTGALIGTAVATEPIGRAGDPLEQIPRHQIESRTIDEARAMTASQNQYPLETPEGVIEVGELAYHGRLRHRMREQPLYGAQSEADAFAIPDEARHLATDSEPRGIRNQPANFVPLEDGIFENSAPTAQASAPATPQTAAPRTRFAQRSAALEGKARVIDVEAQFATAPQ